MKLKRLFGPALCCLPLLAAAETLPYQNPALSAEERAADLCRRLTLEEKAALMMNSSPAIERLGIPAFDWWSEALHGVGRNGLCTVFPSCIGMACSFDDRLITDIYTAVSDEARAKNTAARRVGKPGKYKGLSFWTPNINIFRDPRWGRGQETYGEDPYMNARMGSAVVKALQGNGYGKYYKLHACAKHYAVHSGPEKTRHSFDITGLPARDLWETYLPAFKTLVQDAGVQQVMCAYQRYEGEPCCGSNRLLHQILRDKWGFEGIVVSDCGAIADFWRPGRHGVSADEPAAAAAGVLAGTDVECGSAYRKLPKAVERGDISEADIDISVRRLLKGRFELGDFDSDELVEWTRIPHDVVASPRHKALARKMAQEQCVLLKNNGVLPLAKDASKVMVVGPNAADSVMLWGIYYGQPSHSVTILEGIRDKIGDVAYTKGCGITSMTEAESIFGKLHGPDGKPGLKAEYFNNTDMAGEPVAVVSYTSPISLDNGGNTVFAPGVALTDFTVRMRGSFTADADETLSITMANDDAGRIILNGDTIHNRWKSVDPYKINRYSVNLKKGKRYDIQFDYKQLDGDASLTVDMERNRSVTPEEIVKRAEDYETVIFAGGISPALEREEARINEPGFDNGDRTNIELPAVQRRLLKALHDAGKRVVLVNCSGSAVALVPEERETCDAILQAWYPGEQGGHAVADILFGDCNPSGKLAVTFYNDDSELPPFDDYAMEGRTYRYFRGKPLYEFGHGLSYTTFKYGKASYKEGKLTVELRNTGKRDGTECVLVYLRRPGDTTGPVKTLRAYQRVALKAGEKTKVEIALPEESFEWWDADKGEMGRVPGDYELLVGDKRVKVSLAKL